VTTAEVIGHVDKHNRPRSPSSFYIRDHEDSDAFLAEIDTFESQSQEEITNLPDEIFAKSLAIMVGLDQEDSHVSDKARSTCGVLSLATVEATDATLHQEEMGIYAKQALGIFDNINFEPKPFGISTHMSVTCMSS
jgi:hypothetical protein